MMKKRFSAHRAIALAAAALWASGLPAQAQIIAPPTLSGLNIPQSAASIANIASRAPNASDDYSRGYNAPSEVGQIILSGNVSGNCSGQSVVLSAPNVGSMQATANLLLNASGQPLRIIVSNPGFGYTSPPTVTVNGCSVNPTATAVLTQNGDLWNVPGVGLYTANRTILGQASWQQLLGAIPLPLDAVGAPATAVTVAAGGSGYAVGDTITLASGTILTVATVSSGAVATVTITNPGGFQQFPSTTQAQSVTSGSGTGATFNVSAFVGAFSPRLLTKAYTANKAYDVTCSVSGVLQTKTIGFNPDGSADTVTPDSFCGLSIQFISRAYNQFDPSGNTDATQATASLRPVMDRRILSGNTRAWAFGLPSGSQPSNGQTFVLPAGFVGNTTAESSFFVGRNYSENSGSTAYMQLTTSGNPYYFGQGYLGHFFSRYSSVIQSTLIDGTTSASAQFLISTPTSQIFGAGNAEETIASAQTSAAISGGYYGYSPSLGNSYPSESSAALFYSGDISANRQTLKVSLDATFGLTPQTGAQKQLIIADSIGFGLYSGNMLNWVRQMELSLYRLLETHNFAVSGQTVATMVGQLPSIIAPICQTGTVASAIVSGGTNDLFAGNTQITASIASNVMNVTAVAKGTLAANQVVTGTGITTGSVLITGQLSGTTGGVGTYSVANTPDIASETMYLTDSPAILEANLTSEITGLQAAGCKTVFVGTMTARSGSVQQQGSLLAVNSWTRVNAPGLSLNLPGYSVTVIDFGADPIMGNSAFVNSTYFGDGNLHPSPLGYSYMAGIASAVINSVLR